MDLFSILSVPLGFVFTYCYLFVKNYGVALIIFTILAKIIVIPLAVKQQKTTMMQVKYQPKIAELQKKYAKDKQKLSEETQKLYAEEGYSPLGGCLPMIVTLLVTFGLWQVVSKPLTYVNTFKNDTVISVAKAINQAQIPIPGSTDNKTYVFGVKDDTATKQANATKEPNTPDITIYKKDADGINKIDLATVDQIKMSNAINYCIDNNITSVTEKLPDPANYLKLNFRFLGLDLGDRPDLSKPSIIWVIPFLAFITAIGMSLVTRMFTVVTAQTAGTMNTMLFVGPLMSLGFTFTMSASIGVYWIIGNIVATIQAYVLGSMYNPKKYAEQLKLEEAELKAQEKALERAKREENIKERKQNKNSKGKPIKAEYKEIPNEAADDDKSE